MKNRSWKYPWKHFTNNNSIMKENTKYHRKYLSNRYNRQKIIYTAWPKTFSWVKNGQCYFRKKKLFSRAIGCPRVKFSWQGLFLAKDIKTIKGSFIVGLGNLYHYLLGNEAQETVIKNIKVELPQHRAIKIVTHFVFWWSAK